MNVYNTKLTLSPKDNNYTVSDIVLGIAEWDSTKTWHNYNPPESLDSAWHLIAAPGGVDWLSSTLYGADRALWWYVHANDTLSPGDSVPGRGTSSGWFTTDAGVVGIDTITYVANPVLKAGRGYWLRVPSTVSAVTVGFDYANSIIPVENVLKTRKLLSGWSLYHIIENTGWNLLATGNSGWALSDLYSLHRHAKFVVWIWDSGKFFGHSNDDATLTSIIRAAEPADSLVGGEIRYRIPPHSGVWIQIRQ